MGLEANKRLLLATYERWWNAGDVDAVDEMVAVDYVDHSPVVNNAGREGLKDLIREYHRGFPDMREEVEDVIAEGDRVVGRFHLRGTHAGPFLGIAATGAKVDLTGIDIYRIAGGKIVEMWYEEDLLTLMRQLGVVG